MTKKMSHLEESHLFHEIDTDVIIVGAGLSGMVAAYKIFEREPALDVLVLEADDRIGGRLLSKPVHIDDYEAGVEVVDLGGQWFFPEIATPLVDLLKALNIPVEHQKNRGKSIVDYNKPNQIPHEKIFNFKSPNVGMAFSTFVVAFNELCRQDIFDEKTERISMEEYINENVKNDKARAAIKFIILANCGINPRNVTLRFYIFYCNSTNGILNQFKIAGTKTWIKGGAQQICEKIRDSITSMVLTNEPVVSVEDFGEFVGVTTKKETIYAHFAVVAVSPDKMRHIEFSPKLPEDRVASFQNTCPGDLMKFVATYQTPFWTKNDNSGDVFVFNVLTPEEPLLCCFEFCTDICFALSGYIIRSDINLAKTRVLDQLSKYFGNEAQKPLQFMCEEWECGSPSTFFRNEYDCAIVRQPFGRIYWGGAEYSTKWFGSMTGAIWAGNRAALEVLYDLRPASLNPDDVSIIDPPIPFIRERRQTITSYHSLYTSVRSWTPPILIGVSIVGAIVIVWKTGMLSRRK